MNSAEPNGTIAAYDKIIGNTITGALVQALAINTGHLATNAVTADKADIGLLTALLVRGAQMETHSGVFRGVKINDDGIKAYDSSGTNATPTFQVDAVTGAVTMKGSLTSGSTVTGATITGGTIQTSSGSYRAVLSGSSNSVEFYYGGILTGRATANPDGLYLVNGSGAGLRVATDGTVYVMGADDLVVGGTASANRLVTGIGTSAAAANTYMDSAGMLLRSTASAARYKENFRPVDLGGDALLDAVDLVLFDYREDAGGFKDKLGTVADTAVGTALENFVVFEGDEVENFDYGRGAFVMAHTVGREHRRQITNIEARLEALEAP